MNSMNRTIKVYEQITAIFEHRTEKLTSILKEKLEPEIIEYYES